MMVYENPELNLYVIINTCKSVLASIIMYDNEYVPFHYEIRDVGKRLKSTKKQIIWKFRLDSIDHSVELFASMLSGKKKVIRDGQELCL